MLILVYDRHLASSLALILLLIQTCTLAATHSRCSVRTRRGIHLCLLTFACRELPGAMLIYRSLNGLFDSAVPSHGAADVTAVEKVTDNRFLHPHQGRRQARGYGVRVRISQNKCCWGNSVGKSKGKSRTMLFGKFTSNYPNELEIDPTSINTVSFKNEF